MRNTRKASILAASMSVFMASAVNAGPPAPLAPLADVEDNFCFTTPELGGAFLAGWLYDEGTTQNKWGGDLTCMVSGSYNGGGTAFTDEEVDIDMSIFEGWEPLPAGGTAWYACDDASARGQGAEGDSETCGRAGERP